MMNQKPSLISEPIPYKTIFPWLHLFRVFRLAVDFQKILLASAALLLLLLGNQLFDKLPFAPPLQPGTTQQLQKNILFPPQSSRQLLHPLAGSHLLTENSFSTFSFLSDGSSLLEPMSFFTKPVITLFQQAPAGARWLTPRRNCYGPSLSGPSLVAPLPESLRSSLHRTNTLAPGPPCVSH